MSYIFFMEMVNMLTKTMPKFTLLDVGDNLKVCFWFLFFFGCGWLLWFVVCCGLLWLGGCWWLLAGDLIF